MNIWFFSLFFLLFFVIGQNYKFGVAAQDEFTFGGGIDEEIDEVDEKPVLQFVNMTENITISEMQVLVVECQVANKTDYTIRWLDKNDAVISTSKILYIKAVLKKDAGTYVCEAEKGTTKKKKKFNLSVTIPNITISITDSETLAIGGRINRKCSDLGIKKELINTKLTYEWVDSNQKIVSQSDVLDLPIYDLKVQGQYECRLKSQETEKVYTAKTNVAISSGTRASYRVDIIKTPKDFQYKQPFSLKCVVPNYNGNIEYRWYKGNENDVISTNQVLRIKKFDQTTEGTYKCEVSISTPQGKQILTSTITQQINMFKEGKIELAEKPGPNLFVHTGDKKELHCEIEGNSNLRGSNVDWYINGVKYQQGSADNIARIDKQFVSIMVVSNIQMKDQGQYECRVGGVTREANIFVIKRPETINTSPPILRVKEGFPAEFHCQTDNIPNVKNTDLRWRFESKDGLRKYDLPLESWEISNNAITEQTSFVSKYNSKLTDSGYYICTAPNGRTARSELIVSPNPDALILTISPREIKVRPNQQFQIECFSKNKDGRAYGKPEFTFKNGARDSRFVTTKVGPAHYRLTAPNGLPLSDNGMKVTCTSGSSSDQATIYIKDTCPPGHRYCQNGECLENGKFCDGVKDCSDGTDENKAYCRACDPITKTCQNHNGMIPRKNYYLEHWACDGEDDCGNGFDEASEYCNTNFFPTCGGKHFICPDGKKIPRGYLCDSSLDCSDGSDETGCRPPQIIKSSDRNVKAQRNKNLVLTCEASGKPLPALVWRFNWNCIPEDNRYQFTSSSDCNTVTSKLVISNFKPGDDGIYNCEALSSTKRAFSDDILVTLSSQN